MEEPVENTDVARIHVDTKIDIRKGRANTSFLSYVEF